MKSTDIAKKDRELKRAQKHAETLARLKNKKQGRSVGDYIEDLAGLFFHDGTKIYNIGKSTEIQDLLEEARLEVAEKHWDNILRKSIKKTGVKDKEAAYNELKGIFDSLE